MAVIFLINIAIVGIGFLTIDLFTSEINQSKIAIEAFETALYDTRAKLTTLNTQIEAIKKKIEELGRFKIQPVPTFPKFDHMSPEVKNGPNK